MGKAGTGGFSLSRAKEKFSRKLGSGSPSFNQVIASGNINYPGSGVFMPTGGSGMMFPIPSRMATPPATSEVLSLLWMLNGAVPGTGGYGTFDIAEAGRDAWTPASMYDGVTPPAKTALGVAALGSQQERLVTNKTGTFVLAGGASKLFSWNGSVFVDVTAGKLATVAHSFLGMRTNPADRNWPDDAAVIGFADDTVGFYQNNGTYTEETIPGFNSGSGSLNAMGGNAMGIDGHVYVAERRAGGHLWGRSGAGVWTDHGAIGWPSPYGNNVARHVYTVQKDKVYVLSDQYLAYTEWNGTAWTQHSFSWADTYRPVSVTPYIDDTGQVFLYFAGYRVADSKTVIGYVREGGEWVRPFTKNGGLAVKITMNQSPTDIYFAINGGVDAKGGVWHMNFVPATFTQVDVGAQIAPSQDFGGFALQGAPE